ncbi:hypothetical protein D3C83_134850 [compost metagenome]
MRYNFACGFAQIGERDLALDLLGPVFEGDGAETMKWAKVDPDLNPVRDDPRFTAMMDTADSRLAAPAT